MPFQKMGLIEPVAKAVRAEGYTQPTAIQSKTYAPIAEGRDLLGCAQTGTGKTAAFSWPILKRLHEGTEAAKKRAKQDRRTRRPIRCLILSPTRELAAQISDSFTTYGRNLPLKHTVIFGGVGQTPQVEKIKAGVDTLVATPGRLLDLIGQGHVKLDHVEVFVLDEADRMLDMGFIHDIRKVVEHIPTKRQTLMFSATMPGEIRKLADTLLTDPVSVSVAPTSSAAETVDQTIYHIARKGKPLLLEHLLMGDDFSRTLVFSRTKRGADRITKRLNRAGITAAAIHSDKSQGARTRALDMFKSGKMRVLVASDIAARGIDVEQVSHVINYDLPNEPETYVHRIGRTGRAGAEGRAISFCDTDEHDYLRDIERLLKKAIPVFAHHFSEHACPLPTAHAPRDKGKQAHRSPKRPNSHPRNRNRNGKRGQGSRKSPQSGGPNRKHKPKGKPGRGVKR